MKRIIISILLVPAIFTAQAQNEYNAVLQQIEQNNTMLSALRQQTEAQKLGNRTGLAPANPEIEFNYLWGNPSAIGNRTDFSVTQTFDFPTVYAHRSKIANLQNENAEMQYKAERLTILLSAKQACVELVYYNAILKEYTVRLHNAELIANAYKFKLDKGEANILEHNKAQLNLTTIQAEVAQMEVERSTLIAELRRLNGGKELSTYDFQLSTSVLPANFEEW